MTRTLLAALALMIGGCAPEDEYPPILNQAGDPCRTAIAFCLDDQTVRECLDGTWTDRSCEQSCAEQGPAMLSRECAEQPVEGCVCVPEPGACAPGSTACESDNQLGHCDDMQIWTIHDCDSLCEASLATPVSIGCDVGEDGVAACWCVAAG